MIVSIIAAILAAVASFALGFIAGMRFVINNKDDILKRTFFKMMEEEGYRVGPDGNVVPTISKINEYFESLDERTREYYRERRREING